MNRCELFTGGDESVKVLENIGVVGDVAGSDIGLPGLARSQPRWQRTAEDFNPAPVLIPHVGNFDIRCRGDIHDLDEEVLDWISNEVCAVGENPDDGRLGLRPALDSEKSP